jgi:hypothetical protein
MKRPMDAVKPTQVDRKDSFRNVAVVEGKEDRFHPSVAVVALNASMKRGGLNEAVDD